MDTKGIFMNGMRFFLCIALFSMSGYLYADESGFALTWEQGNENAENALVEGAMQLWGFVDLLKVIAITPAELDVIMARCAGYILELYVQIRTTVSKVQKSEQLTNSINVFRECCAALAQVEEEYYKKCGVFCVLLHDMCTKLS